MNHRRSNIEIIAEMLRIGGEEGAGKTKLMYSVNLSYYQLQKYLGFLMTNGFIDTLIAENHHFNYRVTEKGSKLLESIGYVLEALGFEDK